MPKDLRAEQYRRKAAEARKMADAIGDQISLKDEFLKTERAWLELAEQAERNETQQQQQQQGTEPDESDQKS